MVARAIFPLVPVDHKPVGISIIWPPADDIPVGAVIVLIVVVPDTNVMGAVGVIVSALAIVGAVKPVA